VQALVLSTPPSRQLQFVPDLPDPEPRAGEVLVRVQLAGICATDLELARGYMQFAGVPGHEFVGTVVDGDEQWVGRRVVTEINCPCLECDLCRQGLTNHCPRRTVLGISGRDGAFAELLTIPARNCHVVPDTITDQQAVFVEPLAAAAHVLDAAEFTPETRVVVLGSGRLGLLVAQVLAAQGCRPEVLGRNPRTLELCARHGMRTHRADEVLPRGGHHVVVECTGSPEGLRLALGLCRPQGTIVLKSTYAEAAPFDLAPLVVNELRLVGSRCGPFPAALRLLAERRVEVDEMVSAVYPLRRGVEALEAAARPDNIKVLLQPGLT
jgi:threonine dehydrogenase-like Zn-dependent dehydrogenase